MSVGFISFGRSGGEPGQIERLETIPAEIRDMLAQAGFRHFLQSPVSIAQMAGAAARSAIAASGRLAAQIGGVMVVTESLWDADVSAAGPAYLNARDEILEVLTRGCGLVGAPVYANWMSGCGNLAPALALAIGLADSADRPPILVVSADRAPPSRPRLAPNGASVFGDTAAACVLGSADCGLQLADVVLSPSTDLLALRGNAGFAATARALRQGVLQLDQAVSERAGRRLRDFDLLIFENFSPVLVNFCGQALGASPQAVRTPSLSEFGHTYSSDLLLSIDLLRRSGDIGPGVQAAAISISSWMLGAILIEGG